MHGERCYVVASLLLLNEQAQEATLQYKTVATATETAIPTASAATISAATIASTNIPAATLTTSRTFTTVAKLLLCRRSSESIDERRTL